MNVENIFVKRGGIAHLDICGAESAVAVRSSSSVYSHVVGTGVAEFPAHLVEKVLEVVLVGARYREG